MTLGVFFITMDWKNGFKARDVNSDNYVKPTNCGGQVHIIPMGITDRIQHIVCMVCHF